MLAALVHWRRRYAGGVRQAGDWYGAAALFVYAAAFSFSYVSVATGLGALLLFGAVQLTMIMAGILAGERPRAWHRSEEHTSEPQSLMRISYALFCLKKK